MLPSKFRAGHWAPSDSVVEPELNQVSHILDLLLKAGTAHRGSGLLTGMAIVSSQIHPIPMILWMLNDISGPNLDL